MGNMLRLGSLVLLVITASMTTLAQRGEDPPWVKGLMGKRIVYEVPGMRRVRVTRNLTYKQVAGRDLKMDVYHPTTRTPSPAVLFIHGGRIPKNLLTTPKDWAVYVSFGQLVAASGFVGITFNHRFHAWESLPDSQSDVIDAITYVRTRAKALGVDPNRINLWAVSAGGIFLSQPLRERPGYLSSIVAYYAELDLQNERASAPPSITDETLRNFSPVYFVGQENEKPLPPMFVARAGLDDPNLNDGLDRFVKAALKANGSLELFNHPTGHHGFDIEDNNARSREILKRTIEFLKTH
jgi:acetyl esterase/lipase